MNNHLSLYVINVFKENWFQGLVVLREKKYLKKNLLLFLLIPSIS